MSHCLRLRFVFSLQRSTIVNVTTMLINVLAWFLSFVALVAIMNIDVQTVLIPISSILLGLGFAYGKTLQDVTTSLYLIYGVRPFEVGDWITLNNDGNMYEVQYLGLLTTRMRGFPDGRTVFIPNASIYGSVVSNHSKVNFFLLARTRSLWISLEISSGQQ